jgi:[lysine-biosynthesis-protein LysW]---L-2-aminoadipate ligase
VAYERIDDRETNFDLNNPEPWMEYGVIFERSLSYMRGLYATQILNAWGIPTVNMSHVAATCGDKLATSTALARAGSPAAGESRLYPEAALEAIEEWDTRWC